jgi:hypothetical protein
VHDSNIKNISTKNEPSTAAPRHTRTRLVRLVVTVILILITIIFISIALVGMFVLVVMAIMRRQRHCVLVAALPIQLEQPPHARPGELNRFGRRRSRRVRIVIDVCTNFLVVRASVQLPAHNADKNSKYMFEKQTLNRKNSNAVFTKCAGILPGQEY